MISKEEVKHIAKLSRLELTEKEIEDMQKNLSAVLDYFNLLKKADTKNVKKQPVIVQVSDGQARKDQVLSVNREVAEKIIKSFSDKKDDYIKVRTIL